jgi:hypothetical protein
MRISQPVQPPIVWCLTSHLIGNVVNEAEVESETFQGIVVGKGQNPRLRGREETIVREGGRAGAERDVPGEKGECNRALTDEHSCFVLITF